MRLSLARVAAVLALMFVVSPAYATLLYISEYQVVPTLQNGQVVPVAVEPSTDQTPVNFGGGATASSAFASSTTYVRVWCDVQCSIVFGKNPTATNSNKPLAATTAAYFWVPAGAAFKISVISNP